MNTRASIIDNIEQKIILILGSFLLLQALAYIYFVNSTFFNVLARKEAEENISVAETEITDFVTDYMALSERVNLPLAYEKGFVDAPVDGVFAAIAPVAVALSFNNEI